MVQKKDYERLIEAVKKSDHKRLRNLLEKGLNPNDREPSRKIHDGFTIMDTWVPDEYSKPGPRPLDVALKAEDVTAVALLLKYGAKTDDPKKITEFRTQLENKSFFRRFLSQREK